LKQKLAAFGAQKVNLLKDGWPYIFIGQKGGNAILELLPDTNAATPANQQSLLGIRTLRSSLESGTIASPLIGPATDWQTLTRHFESNSSSSKWEVNIYGQNLTGLKTLLFNGIPSQNLDLNSIANPSSYPYLQLESTVKDSISLVPPQLKKWQILFTGVPEGTLYFDPSVIDTTIYHSQKRQEGESFSLKFAFKNISPIAFSVDSLPVIFTIQNASMGKQIKLSTKIKSPQPDSVVVFSQIFNTTDLIGENSIQIYVNPQQVPEMYYGNNVYQFAPFTVEADNSNPVLDVVFDGKHIKNGEKVSPNVLITTVIKDESRIKFKRDTIGIKMLLRKPCGATEADSCEIEEIKLAHSNVTITYPERHNQNRLTIQYQTQNLQEGIHRFWVNGTDASGNLTGLKPYSVDFEVVDKCELLDFYIYPNPTNEGCSFYIQIVCPDVLDKQTIKIQDLQGREMRFISEEELKISKAGNNILDFYWDGTSTGGAKLPSGLYIFKYEAQSLITNQKIQKTGKISIVK
jgi:flagellar hook assembly protein FlgD